MLHCLLEIGRLAAQTGLGALCMMPMLPNCLLTSEPPMLVSLEMEMDDADEPLEETVCHFTPSRLISPFSFLLSFALSLL